VEGVAVPEEMTPGERHDGGTSLAGAGRPGRLKRVRSIPQVAFALSQARRVRSFRHMRSIVAIIVVTLSGAASAQDLRNKPSDVDSTINPGLAFLPRHP